jgi:hypothetical protein
LFQHQVSKPETVPEDFRVVAAGDQSDIHRDISFMVVFNKMMLVGCEKSGIMQLKG